MSRVGRAVAYLIVCFGFVLWVLSGGSKDLAVLTLGAAAVGYGVGSAYEKVRQEQRRRAAVRRANREGL